MSRQLDHNDEPCITCPQCSMTSYHPEDIRQGYCGNCHHWTSEPLDLTDLPVVQAIASYFQQTSKPLNATVMCAWCEQNPVVVAAEPPGVEMLGICASCRTPA